MTARDNPESAGKLFGIGVGPGDPELVTVKAQRLIGDVDVVAYPCARHGNSVARSIASDYFTGDQIELAMMFPVTTEATDHPGGYEGALRDYYDDAASEIATHLQEGRSVGVLCEGDPFFYGSYMYIHERLAPRFETVVIPGVTSFSAAASAAGRPLAKRDDVLTILPGTLDPAALTQHLADADAAVVMKLGRTFANVREAAEQAGVAPTGIYVERASSDRERTCPLEEVEGDVPYMSLVLFPTADGDAHSTVTQPRPDDGVAARGSVTVIGLGPAGQDWLTPEARRELAQAQHLIGYGPYIDRVPSQAGQQRHGSDNRVEMDRARFALELAADGSRVAVVSSGDPGIFAMASAVFEAVDSRNGELPDIELRVIPGLSAMQAAAARVGAPLGHDFCAISLSDQLKPWSIIERRLKAAGEADLVVALYNPASRTRRDQLARAIEVLGNYRSGDAPVVVARAVGSEQEQITVTTIDEIDLETVDMRTLLIVGSTTTRAIASPAGASWVYTPRSYPE